MGILTFIATVVLFIRWFTADVEMHRLERRDLDDRRQQDGHFVE